MLPEIQEITGDDRVMTSPLESSCYDHSLMIWMGVRLECLEALLSVVNGAVFSWIR